MSRRDRRRDATTPKGNAHSTPAPANVQPAQKLRGLWKDVAIISAIVSALVGGIAGPITTTALTYFVDDWTAPVLVYGSTETILINGRVVTAVVTNTGRNVAKDVVIVIDAFHPTFKFAEAHHVHTFPLMPVETSIKGMRMEVKLMRPLGRNQTVRVLLDDIAFKDGYQGMFGVSVSSDRGQATFQGHDVQSFPTLTLDQFLFASGRTNEVDHAAPSR
jgi:hypothetical protein